MICGLMHPTGNAIELNETLTCLNVGEHRLSKVASSILIDSLKKNTTIDTLLADEGFTRRLQNARRLDDAVHALQSNDARLSAVDLTSCIETEVQGMAVVDALEKNSVLRSLTLRGTPLGAPVSKRLFEVLACNHTLTSLTLTGALTSDEEIKALAVAIKTNATLSFLSIRGCPMSDSAVEALTDALRVNDTITKLRCDTAVARALPLVHLNEKLCSAIPSLALSDAASRHLEKTPYGKNKTLDAQEYKTCLFEAIELSKYGWIRHILEMAPVVARCRWEDPEDTAQGELAHTLVLRKKNVHEPTLLRLFRSHFELDAYLSRILDTKGKLQALERVLLRLSGEKWRDDEGNTVMHRILLSVHDGTLRHSHVHGLCVRLCELHPEHAFVTNHKGITPIEMATLCGGRICQFFTPMVLMLVEERTRIVLDLDEAPNLGQTPVDTVSQHDLGFTIGATNAKGTGPALGNDDVLLHGGSDSHGQGPALEKVSRMTQMHSHRATGAVHGARAVEDSPVDGASTTARPQTGAVVDEQTSIAPYGRTNQHRTDAPATQAHAYDATTQKKWDLKRIFNRRGRCLRSLCARVFGGEGGGGWLNCVRGVTDARRRGVR